MSAVDRDEPADRNARIADYVLGQMSAVEAETFERDMASDKTLAREVFQLQDHLSEIDATARALPANAALWSRIEEGLNGTAQQGSSPSAAAAARPSLWESLRFWRGATALAAALAIACLAGLGVVLRGAASEPVYVAVLLAEDGSGAGAVVEIDAAGYARLTALRDIPVPEGRALQVWTLQDRDVGPISVGLIPEAQSIALAIESLPPTRAEQLFEITLEPETGSPTGRPTGPILFKGTTAQAL